MSTVKVPPGWIRKKVGKKIVYITDSPRVRIWKISEFDAIQKKGRFSTIPREMLSFSIKVRRKIVEVFPVTHKSLINIVQYRTLSDNI